MSRMSFVMSLVSGLLFACSSSKAPSGPGSSSSGPASDLGAGDPGGGGVRFTASGEALAVTGFSFPPSSADALSFVDGWAVTFSRVLVTVDHLTLSDMPDLVAGDASRTGGELARLRGPWAIDLARSDPSNLPGKGGAGEQAVAFASLRSDALATDGARYAFGYDVVPATPSARRVNLAGDAGADYDAMVAEGCAVLYVGVARFKGDKSNPDCYPESRKSWPDEVAFRLCFKTPTTYLNCQNPDNDPAEPFADEEHQRGIALKSESSVTAQITLHTEHPFWDSVIHDAPAHFDGFAARARGKAGTPTVTMADLEGVDYTGMKDAAGVALEWRYCVEPPTDAHAKAVGPMRFDARNVPHARGDDPSSGLRDYRDFVAYNQSTQGHLNADGLCFAKRNYPSPP